MDGMSGGPVFWPGHGLQGILHGGGGGEAQAAGLDSIRRFLNKAGIRIDGARYTLAAADLVPVEPAPIPLPDEQTIGPATPEPDPAPPEYRRPATPDPISTPAQDPTDTGRGDRSVGSAAGLVDAVIPPTSAADRARRSLEAKIEALTTTIATLVQTGAPRSPPGASGRDPPATPPTASSAPGQSAKASDASGSLFDLVAAVAPYALTAAGAGTLSPAVYIGLALWRRRRQRKERERQTRAEVGDGTRRSPPAWNLNDDYAEQLARVYQLSGRSPLGDVTLGREYDEELRRAAESSDATLSKWARDLRDRVAGRFHRIHGASPVPAEPVASTTP